MIVNAANKVIVGAYKATGFVVLGVLLLGLVSFIGVNAFFFVSRTWVAPTVVSPSDERVLALLAQMSEASTARDRLVAERTELAARRDSAERVVAAQHAFQEEFRAAIEAELRSRTAQLARFEGLRGEFRARGAAIRTANARYATTAKDRLDELWRAHLVDSEGYVGAGHELAEIGRTELGLAEAQTSLEDRVSLLRRDVEALRAMAAERPGPAASTPRQLSYQVLQMKDQYERSLAELARAEADRRVAVEAIAANERAVGRYDRILQVAQTSPLLEASEKSVTVAFVPYDNLSRVAAGTPVVACRAGILWCRRVGRVAERLEGEVSERHPLYNRPERGVLVRVALDEAAAGNARVLFAGGAPLGL